MDAPVAPSSESHLPGERPHVSRLDIFSGFFLVGMFGFGGIAAAMHHVIVERRGWLNDQEYASVLGLGQVLPGANLVNMATIVGDRFCGFVGAVLALAGLIFMPIVILIILATTYDQFATNPDVIAATRAAAAGAVGLMFGTAYKIGKTVVNTRWALFFAILSFVSIGLLRLPLVGTLLVLGPISVAVSFWRSER
ncbi:MAG: chromate transporter [Hyphomicrobiales bacterium]|nr:chromate transporter [Hyphomicrobiales bacterium]